MPEQSVFDELEAQYDAFDRTLEELGPDVWSAPTMCAEWNVRDLVCHLMLQAEVAHASALGDGDVFDTVPDDIGRFDSWVDRAVKAHAHVSGPDAWNRWRESRTELVPVLRGMPDDAQIRWTLMRMRPTMLATILAVDAWAHHHDVRVPQGLPRRDGPVLRHVALFAWKALPWACSITGEEYAPVRFELTSPDGELWTFGDESAPAVRGDALDLCLVAVRRRTPTEATSLTAEGPAAEAALRAVRCFP